MIGLVSPQLLPMIRLRLKSGDVEIDVDLIVDTGFNGTLSLTAQTIAQLAPPFIQFIESTLADGSVIETPTYLVETDWNGTAQTLGANLTHGDALIGTALLLNHELRVEVRDGGAVSISPLTN